VTTFRDARILRAGVAGFVVWLGACSLPSGPHNAAGATVSGTVSSSVGGGIVNATVTVTPTASASLPAVQTSTGGAYTVVNVPAGDGNLAVSNLPTNCQSVSIQYTGIRNGGSRIINIVVPCS
jgi:hypothetical protein